MSESKFLALSLMILWRELEHVSTCKSQPQHVLSDGEVCKTEESLEGPDGGIILTFSQSQ